MGGRHTATAASRVSTTALLSCTLCVPVLSISSKSTALPLPRLSPNEALAAAMCLFFRRVLVRVSGGGLSIGAPRIKLLPKSSMLLTDVFFFTPFAFVPFVAFLVCGFRLIVTPFFIALLALVVTERIRPPTPREPPRFSSNASSGTTLAMLANDLRGVQKQHRAQQMRCSIIANAKRRQWPVRRRQWCRRAGE